MSSLGQRLKALRKERDLNQIDVAVAVGIDRTHLSNIERDGDPPGRQTLTALANFYDVSVDWLLSGEGSSRAPSRKGTLVSNAKVNGNASEQKLNEQMLFIWENLGVDVKIAALSVVKALVEAWPKAS